MPLEVLHHQLVVDRGDLFEEDPAPRGDGVRDLGGDLLLRLVGEQDGLVPEQVDDANERLVLDDRDLDRDELALELLAQGGDGLFEAHVLLIQVIHEDEGRSLQRLDELPRTLGDDLHPLLPVHDEDGEIAHRDSLVHLLDKLVPAGGVDEREPRPLHLARPQPEVDRVAPMLLLLGGVEADWVLDAALLEERGDEGGLAGRGMTHHADAPRL